MCPGRGVPSSPRHDHRLDMTLDVPEAVYNMLKPYTPFMALSERCVIYHIPNHTDSPTKRVNYS